MATPAMSFLNFQAKTTIGKNAGQWTFKQQKAGS